MSWRLILLDMYLRVFQKPSLARLKNPDEGRALMRAAAARLPAPPAAVNFSAARVVGEAGDIPVEWAAYGRPDRRRIVLYIHGGAFFMGSPETHRAITAALTRETGARVMAPDYRLAPEHPLPAGLNDIRRCFESLLESGYAPEAIALAGDSAGGGLCFSLLLEIQRLGLPRPACVVAFSPWTDLTLSGQSIRRNAMRDALLPASRLREAADLYLGGAPAESLLASPAKARFEGPPPTLIQVGSTEILRDDALTMAETLRTSGGDVHLEIWRAAPHAFQSFAPILPEGEQALNRAGAFIRGRMPAPDIE